MHRLVLADEVSRTLFAEFAEHRLSDRGDEETGWVLLGLRTENEAIVLATLPAGANRDAGDSHVRFDPIVQAAASRVVRQGNRNLTMLGVVHTHPGSLRHPSDGDFRGDIAWVGNLRGSEGIFGIGTADAKKQLSGQIAWQPGANVQCLDKLCLSWYSLREGDRSYRPLEVTLTIGPDLALQLRPVWPELERHAEQLERLALQLRDVSFIIVDGMAKPALAVQTRIADSDRSIRALIEGSAIRYLLMSPDGPQLAGIEDDCVDRGIFLMLAELTSQSRGRIR